MLQNKSQLFIEACYYSVIGLFVVGYFFPQARLWGINLWTYFPATVALPALAAALLAPSIIRFFGRETRGQNVRRHQSFWLWAAVVAVVFGASFYLLRVRLYFLGDGYTLIANLASDSPIVKMRNFGEMMAHQLAFAIIGKGGEKQATLAYQIVSYIGGAAFIVTALYASRLLFDELKSRILFLLGLLTGGYMLLFFGYAEHYSLFVPSVTLYTLIGIMVSNGRIHRLYLLIPLMLSIFFHAFGIMLIPSAIYLLTAGTRAGERFSRFSVPIKIVIISLAVAVTSAMFFFFYQTSYFFRLAFVPFWQGRFTLEGYTLLSWPHLVDLFNLVILLFPGLPLVLAALWFTRDKQSLVRGETVFFGLLLLPALTAVVLLDPKLGMARDWDLFAFASVVTVFAAFYLLLRRGISSRISFMAAILAIALGAYSLGARVAGQVDKDIALRQAVDYAKLDKKKNMFALFQMHDYCWKYTDYERSPLYNFDWEGNFPEWGLVQTGLKLKADGMCGKAMPLFESAIKEHPALALAYYGLGSCYLTVGRVDSAVYYLEIANGLNPHDIHIHNDLAHAYLSVRDLHKAEIHFESAISIDGTNMQTYVNLAEFYSLSGQDEKELEILRGVASLDDAPAEIFKLLGDYYIRHRFFDDASREYQIALEKGLPRDELEPVIRTYPQLKL
ncbi:MAG: tetratricopeptide repeat protein [Candidatus Zixiibacteriota bacterium]